MAKIHPHAEATYRVIQQQDGGFAVELALPDSYPTLITRFDTAASAEAWIANHQRQVEDYPTAPRRRFMGRS